MKKIAFIGCGYISEYYAATLTNYSDLQLAGVYDINQYRAEKFAVEHDVHCYKTITDLLSDDSIKIIVNLTNPESHYKVSKEALLAGKHVYSEKPLALKFEHAKELVEIAQDKQLKISAAPCSVLSEPAQNLFRALKDNEIGKIRLIYAELDDGAIHMMKYKNWKNPAGISWPYLDEFETGSTLEHAGYTLSWLTAFFGPAQKVHAFSKVIFDNKCKEITKDNFGTDFTLAIIQFKNDVVARFTCGFVAPFDHRLQIIGDDGILSTDECWDFKAPVYIQRAKIPHDINKWESHIYLKEKTKYNKVNDHNFRKAYNDTHNMDFARGVKELCDSITEERRCRLSSNHALHVTELVCAIDNARFNQNFQTYIPETSFEPLEMMPWTQNDLSRILV